MFVHIGIHRPKPEHVDEVIASMRRVDAVAEGLPGLVSIGPWREVDADGDIRLVGIATWESRAAFEAGAPRIFAVVADDPFDVWESARAENIFLEEA